MTSNQRILNFSQPKPEYLRSSIDTMNLEIDSLRRFMESRIRDTECFIALIDSFKRKRDSKSANWESVNSGLNSSNSLGVTYSWSHRVYKDVLNPFLETNGEERHIPIENDKCINTSRQTQCTQVVVLSSYTREFDTGQIVDRNTGNVYQRAEDTDSRNNTLMRQKLSP